MKKLSLVFLFFLTLNVSGQELKQKSSISEFIIALEKSDAQDVLRTDKFIEFYLKDEFYSLTLKPRTSWRVEKINDVFYLTGTAKNKKNVIIDKVTIIINLDEQLLTYI